jgi:hypothetical protein
MVKKMTSINKSNQADFSVSLQFLISVFISNSFHLLDVVLGLGYISFRSIF